MIIDEVTEHDYNPQYAARRSNSVTVTSYTDGRKHGIFLQLMNNTSDLQVITFRKTSTYSHMFS